MKAVAALFGAVAIGLGWANDKPLSKGPPPCREAAFVSARTGKVLRRFSALTSAVDLRGYDTGPLLPGGDATPDGHGGWFVAGYGIRRLSNDGRLVNGWRAHPRLSRVVGGLTRIGERLYVTDGYYVYAFSAKSGERLWRSQKFAVGTRVGISALVATRTTVYIGGYFDHRELAALDARSGRLLRWHTPRFGYYRGSYPVVDGLALSRTRLYFAGGFLSVAGVARRGGVAAVRLADGSLTSFKPKAKTWNVGALAVSGRRVLIGGREGGGVFDDRTGVPLRGSKDVEPAAGGIFINGSTAYLGGNAQSQIALYNLEAMDLRTGKVRTWFPKLAPRVWSAGVEGVVQGEVFVGGQFCSS
jgi:hypothetical protein